MYRKYIKILLYSLRNRVLTMRGNLRAKIAPHFLKCIVILLHFAEQLLLIRLILVKVCRIRVWHKGFDLVYIVIYCYIYYNIYSNAYCNILI